VQENELPSIDLNQRANVLWFAVPAPADAASFGGHTRQFESVTAAIRFVMEELPFYGRSTARITTEQRGTQRNKASLRSNEVGPARAGLRVVNGASPNWAISADASAGALTVC
jgi:hypothetical protein